MSEWLATAGWHEFLALGGLLFTIGFFLSGGWHLAKRMMEK